jgi:hypothetical protein
MGAYALMAPTGRFERSRVIFRASAEYCEVDERRAGEDDDIDNREGRAVIQQSFAMVRTLHIHIREAVIMNVTVILPEVSSCTASACTYNAAGRCHAPAITIGGAQLQPICDTALADARKVMPSSCSGVGACKVDSCVYNRERTCQAVAIDVRPRSTEAPLCTTYQPRSTGATGTTGC